MKQTEENIWYASYGSNILEERFLCYIRGGQLLGASKNYIGCTDKSLPLDKKEICINRELYFAKKSKIWDNGGVCFIKTNFEPRQKTLGRMYLITKGQFIDIVRQETNNTDELIINFRKAMADGSLIFKEKSWYGNIIYLGNQNSSPIFTFTHQGNIEQTNKPSASYLKIIIKGIQETYNLSVAEIYDYLIAKQGIVDEFTRDELENIIKNIDEQK
ncbi:MAG: hypothetical protein PHD97_12740 [Bacteroidales bacterium]|nr:hypothetical protein [Bacteroidales bacterium]